MRSTLFAKWSPIKEAQKQIQIIPTNPNYQNHVSNNPITRII